MSQTRTFATHYDYDRVIRSVLFKASTDAKSLTSTALLSYPEPDLAGDIVVPEGMDFSRHMADPRVDIEHRRDPDFGDATVGWARTTCKARGGFYTVRPVDLDCDGKTRPLPVATTHFDPSDRLEMQAFAFVERDILPAVSVEFIPDMTVAKAIGWSDLERRKAYEFNRVHVVRYTLCRKGVCPSALVAKSTYDPLAAVLSANRIGSEQLHPTIKKALAPLVASGKSTTVTVPRAVEKADMDSYTGTSAPPVDTPAPADDMPEAAPVNGVSAIYAHAEALLSECEQLEQAMESTDSAELIKVLRKLCEAATSAAEKAKAEADKHDAKLQAAKKKGDGEPEPVKEESDDYKPDMDKDDEGGLKAVRQCYKPVLKACREARSARYSLAQITKAEREKVDRAEAARKAQKSAKLAAARAEFAAAQQAYG